MPKKNIFSRYYYGMPLKNFRQVEVQIKDHRIRISTQFSRPKFKVIRKNPWSICEIAPIAKFRHDFFLSLLFQIVNLNKKNIFKIIRFLIFFQVLQKYHSIVLPTLEVTNLFFLKKNNHPILKTFLPYMLFIQR